MSLAAAVDQTLGVVALDESMLLNDESVSADLLHNAENASTAGALVTAADATAITSIPTRPLKSLFGSIPTLDASRGVSVAFLILWCLGDLAMLAAAILMLEEDGDFGDSPASFQSHISTFYLLYSSTFFIISDGILLSQCLYYSFRRHQMHRRWERETLKRARERSSQYFTGYESFSKILDKYEGWKQYGSTDDLRNGETPNRDAMTQERIDKINFLLSTSMITMDGRNVSSVAGSPFSFRDNGTPFLEQRQNERSHILSTSKSSFNTPVRFLRRIASASSFRFKGSARRDSSHTLARVPTTPKGKVLFSQYDDTNAGSLKPLLTPSKPRSSPKSSHLLSPHHSMIRYSSAGSILGRASPKAPLNNPMKRIPSPSRKRRRHRRHDHQHGEIDHHSSSIQQSSLLHSNIPTVDVESFSQHTEPIVSPVNSRLSSPDHFPPASPISPALSRSSNRHRVSSPTSQILKSPIKRTSAHDHNDNASFNSKLSDTASFDGGSTLDQYDTQTDDEEYNLYSVQVSLDPDADNMGHSFSPPRRQQRSHLQMAPQPSTGDRRQSLLRKQHANGDKYLIMEESLSNSLTLPAAIASSRKRNSMFSRHHKRYDSQSDAEEESSFLVDSSIMLDEDSSEAKDPLDGTLYGNGYALFLVGLMVIASQWYTTEASVGGGNARHTRSTLFGAAPNIWPLNTTRKSIGYAFAILSALFYISSRFPQIYWNYTRKSTKGLSSLMFILTMFGNIFFVSSLMPFNQAHPEWFNVFLVSIPFIVGGTATLFFDLLILLQIVWYSSCSKRTANGRPSTHDLTIDIQEPSEETTDQSSEQSKQEAGGEPSATSTNV
eukprot:CAMPEP_0117435814 /NCGR_PEP_ID=MMETSP0759-20121206/679_1 /TAXON_ID=63605 /ORGANISM="Percolomonas cosmopolitus, Strain WS" /LENGTH=834 /DNA_ID=CAMNT_0005227381 /DNA_START=555 /DNA_END=3059 /DNA_ORIENTATION=+